MQQGVRKQRAKYCTKHKAKFKVTLMFADKYWQQSNPDIIYIIYRNITRYYRQNTQPVYWANNWVEKTLDDGNL